MNPASATKAAHFVESILSLQPQVAAFDCDGTLWWSDAGERFFDWELKQGVVSDEITRWARPRYADYKAGNVAEHVMCGEMVTMHRGLREAEVQAAAVRFFDEFFVENIIPEMRGLVRRLREAGCDIWAVSSSNEWVIRAAMRHFGIAENRILASAAEIERGNITDRLVRVPCGPAKVEVIRDRIGRRPDVAFGNSVWDREMLELAKHAVAVNPNPDLAEIARKNGWKSYLPQVRSTE